MQRSRGLQTGLWGRSVCQNTHFRHGMVAVKLSSSGAQQSVFALKSENLILGATSPENWGTERHLG